MTKGMTARAYIGGRDPVAPGGGPLSSVGGATGPLAFFLPRDLVANLKKKLHLVSVALWGRQDSNVIFFFKFATKSLEKKKRGPVAPPTGDRALSRATGLCRPLGGRQGPPHPLFKPWPPFPLSFEPKNSGKKKGVMKHRSINIPSIVYNGKYESDQ